MTNRLPCARIALATLILLAAGALPSRAQNDPVFDAKGFQQNRDYFSQEPYEHIDTLSGSLVLTFTDLVLPGNAGRDLRFQRTFNSKDSQWTFGLAGMAMRIIDSEIGYVGDDRPQSSTPTLLTSDGARRSTAWLFRPINTDPSTLRWVTTSQFWRYDRTDRTLYMPDGTIAHYDLAGHLIDFSDPFGNAVTLAWQSGLLQVVQSLGNGQSRQVNVAIDDTSNFNGCWYITIKNPDGTQHSSALQCGKIGFKNRVTLPTTGLYTLVIDPDGTTSGTVNISLFTVVDIVGSIMPDGPAASATITTPGQVARGSFNATAGQKFSATATPNMTTSSGCYTMAILRADLTQLEGALLCGSSGFMNPVTVPTTGTYWLLVDPDSATIGNVSDIKLYTATDVSGSMAIDGPQVSATLTTPGQIAHFSFSGTAGQRISELTTGTFNSAFTSRIMKPDGSQLVGSFTAGGTNVVHFLEPPLLPVTGTYAVDVDPDSTGTGSVTMSLSTVPADVTGSIVINDPALAVTITAPGQNAAMTFSGTASQSVTVRIGNNTMSTASLSGVTITLVKPDGTALASWPVWINTDTTRTVPTTGTYMITIDPQGTKTGSLALSVTTP